MLQLHPLRDLGRFPAEAIGGELRQLLEPRVPRGCVGEAAGREHDRHRAAGLFRRQLGDPAQALAGEQRGEHPGVKIAHRHPVPARQLRAQRIGR